MLAWIFFVASSFFRFLFINKQLPRSFAWKLLVKYALPLKQSVVATERVPVRKIYTVCPDHDFNVAPCFPVVTCVYSPSNVKTCTQFLWAGQVAIALVVNMDPVHKIIDRSKELLTSTEDRLVVKVEHGVDETPEETAPIPSECESSDSEEEDNNEVVECPASVHSKPESSQVVEMNPSKRHAGSADIEYIEDYDDLETYSFPLPPYSRTDPRLIERTSPLPLRRGPKSKTDTLLRRLGRTRIDRKLNEIRSLVPLLRLRPSTRPHQSTTPVRSDDDLTFLQNMYKIVNILANDFDRPYHAYSVEKIVSVSSLNDMVANEEHLLDATFDIVKHFDEHLSKCSLSEHVRKDVSEDRWIQQEQARDPDLISAAKEELERLGSTYLDTVDGPMVCELPVYTSILKEGLARRLMDAYREAGLESNTDGHRHSFLRFDITGSLRRREQRIASLQVYAIAPSIMRLSRDRFQTVYSCPLDFMITTANISRNPFRRH